MIATILKLTRSDCKALDIKDAYSIHRVVYSLFPRSKDEVQRNFLFADKGGDFNGRRILILSKTKPVEPEYGKIESRNVPESFLQFKKYGFKITLNPVIRNGKEKTTVPVTGKENLRTWFLGKTNGLGFVVDSDSIQVCRMGVMTFTKKKDAAVFNQTHNIATFMGKLEVVDRKLFIKSFEEGIGRAKGFGFGLLQLVPLEDN
ncbi:MAG: type I-E CRISPR-associated protein Cas6/Cse3/CasE [Candidatus Omnitrophota bacterium]